VNHILVAAIARGATRSAVGEMQWSAVWRSRWNRSSDDRAVVEENRSSNLLRTPLGL